MKNNQLLLLLFVILGLFTNCTERGCRDYLASNYNEDATKDDGTCNYYYGGRDFGQLEVSSETDLNSIYSIYIDDKYMGDLSYYFPSGASCGHPQNVGSIFKFGTYKVKAIGSGGNPIREGWVSLGQQKCEVVLVEDLKIVGGGSNPGYSCISGNCEYSPTNGQYSSLSECELNCGGSSNFSLNDTWLSSSGTGIIINGNIGTFYSFSPNYQIAADKGYINVGSQYLKNISKTTSNTWNCNALWLRTTNSVINGVEWSSDGTITMSSDGQSITIVSTGPASGNTGTAVFDRQ